MRKASGTGIGSHGSRIRSDHMTACVTRLRLAPPQNNATLAAVETASNHKGASSPILRLLAASVTASEPKDSQIAIPTTTAVRMLRADTRRIAAAYANERVFAFATGWRTTSEVSMLSVRGLMLCAGVTQDSSGLCLKYRTPLRERRAFVELRPVQEVRLIDPSRPRPPDARLTGWLRSL
jgi:hypothetical protein